MPPTCVASPVTFPPHNNIWQLSGLQHNNGNSPLSNCLCTTALHIESHCGSSLNRPLKINTLNKHEGAFSLDYQSAFLWGHLSCVWPKSPAPGKIWSRQDIRHTLLCPPLCARRLYRSHGRMTVSNNVAAEDSSTDLPLEDTTCRLFWPPRTCLQFIFWFLLRSFTCLSAADLTALSCSATASAARII